MTSLLDDVRTSAEWIARALDSSGHRAIRLRLPDGSVVRPVRRSTRRFANGPQDSVVGHAAALGALAAN
ncbi:hypothetical protein [Streptomyces sp. NPDC001100]